LRACYHQDVAGSLLFVIQAYNSVLMTGERNPFSKVEQSEGKKISASIEAGFSREAIDSILYLESQSFGEEAMYEDADEYYAEMLKNPDNINIFLREGDKRIGYILAIPKQTAFCDDELRAADPELRGDAHGKTYYIETVELLSEYRKGVGFFRMLSTLADEFRNRGITGVAMHARVENGLAASVERFLLDISEIKEKRLIEEWPYYDPVEPTMYIEAEGTPGWKKREVS
jgi:hypothetical protein